MTNEPGIEELTDEVLARLYDSGSFNRGVRYADEGRVELFDGRPGRQNGIVRGTGRQPYVVRTAWFATARGLIIEDQCSCPLGGDCKHCVALLITARRASLPVALNWRDVLSDLAEPSDSAETVRSPLALEFSIHKPARNRWVSNDEPRLLVRPLRLGKTGKWIRTGASWHDIETNAPRWSGLIESQQRILRTMFASIRAPFHEADASPIALARFGHDLWDLLPRVVDAGVSLVGEPTSGSRRPPVVLCAQPALPRFELTAEPTGEMALRVRLVLGDKTVDLDRVSSGMIGDPAHGCFHLDGDALVLTPFDQPLPSSVRGLVGAPPVMIPASDLDELLDVYEPILSRHGTVDSPDGSVVLHQRRLVGPLLQIERVAVDVARLRWGVRYQRGDRMIEHFVDEPTSLGPNLPEDLEALRALPLPAPWRSRLTDASGLPRSTTLRGAECAEIFGEVVPALRDHPALHIEHTGALPALHESAADPLIELVVEDGKDRHGSTTDWFDLGVEVSVNGETIDFATLFAALNRPDPVLILPSGAWIQLDQAPFTQLRALIDEARGLHESPNATSIRINPFQFDWWQELTSLGVIASQSTRWSRNVARLGELTAPSPCPVPAGLAATLRPYQREGYDWLSFLSRHSLGGILADDMGLGKTLQTLALCAERVATDPDAKVLVVAPTSVVENWAREAGRFAPTLRVQTITATASRRGTSFSQATRHASVVITSYALLRLEFEDYVQTEWDLCLFDEAQFLKNRRSKSYRCARTLDARMKIALTGTPLENSLMDLWALLSIVAPGLYPDPDRFSETFRKPIESGRSPERLHTLRRRIAPFLRRRTKDAVLDDLPPKIEQVVDIELSARHARLYATHLQRERAKVLGLVDELDTNRFEILKSLTVLRQLSLDAGLIDPMYDDVGSAKLDRLVDDLTEVIAEGHRALVFSQFTRFLARARARLDQAGISQVLLEGRTRNRAAVIDEFRNGDAPVFLISLKAGGVGLNLTEADYCFILDPWWNPAVEAQAVDRTHRIGQRNTVMVYRYVASNTIEEKVMELKARKSALFNEVIDADGALGGALSSEDIRGLFE